MKQILVVYFTQTGQLKEIIDSVLHPILQAKDVSVDYEAIKPTEDYPFPWGEQFFDFFPESVMGVPCVLKPFSFRPEKDYDLVILAYQSWFLSPSIPFSSFMQSPEALELLNGKKVVTLLGVRNMWISSQEIIKRKIREAGAELKGNIVLVDRSNNWIAAFTIIRWLVNGKKEAKGLFPAAGVSKTDIQQASRFGETILSALQSGDFSELQSKLLRQGAVRVKFDLLLIEKNARKIFVKFARNVLKKSKISQEQRKKGIALFKWYLLFALFLLSPVFSLIFSIAGYLFYPWSRKAVRYYQGITLRK